MDDDAPLEFGPLLRQAREKRGLSLQQVAATTKISARVLEALERNDIAKLPGGIFSRSFVRAYAREVGLDPEETVARFTEAFPADTEDQAPAAASHAVDAESFESGRRTAITLFQILGLSLLVLIAVAVYRNTRPEPQIVLPPPPAPVSSEAPTQPPQPAIPSPAAPVTSAPGTPGEGAGGGEPAGAPTTPPSPAVTVPSPAVTQPPQAAAADVVATPQTPLALSVLASEECWLSLSVDGQKVVARNLQAGERMQFRARNAIVLNTGNAGALALTVNGKPGRTLGGRGEVVTTTITVENAKTFMQ